MSQVSSAPPLVTIAIPTLNRVELLRLTLGSALNQTYRNIEILVSDNASEDGTWDLLQAVTDERVRIHRRPVRLSMYAHWNVILKEARGSYFLLLSDDDILEPHAIEQMVSVFDSNPSAGCVFCGGSIIDSEGRQIMPGKGAKAQLSAEEMILGFFRSELDLWPCAILFRLGDIEQGYPDEFPLGADAAAWMQAVARHGRGVFVAERITRYRVHRNTTMTVGFRPWQIENRNLAAYAIEQLHAHGRGSAALNRRISASCRRLNIRIAAGLIKSSAGATRFGVMRRLGQNLEQFASPYGILVLLKTLIELSFPQSCRGRLVHWSRTIRGVRRVVEPAQRG